MLFKKKDNLPPFFMSSVPKSGTHLMHQMINGIPHVTNDLSNEDQFFYLDHRLMENNILHDHFFRLSKLQPNECGYGHVFYSKAYAAFLQHLKLKHVFIYRDPRDILVSLAYFIPTWEPHPFYYLFKNVIIDNKERMKILLSGIHLLWPNFDASIRPFFNWIHDPNTLSISFEDLVRSDESRRAALMRIVEYLWQGLTPPASYHEMVRLMESNINPQKSVTFRKGKIGSWREEFDDELIRRFKAATGNLLIDFGYEKNNDW